MPETDGVMTRYASRWLSTVPSGETAMSAIVSLPRRIGIYQRVPAASGVGTTGAGPTAPRPSNVHPVGSRPVSVVAPIDEKVHGLRPTSVSVVAVHSTSVVGLPAALDHQSLVRLF